jgi:hypothetical protein
MIGIGVQMGGPEQRDSVVKAVLLKAMQTAERVRDPSYKDGTEAWINPIFIVPGSLLQPDFDGMKTGHFSRREKGLVIQVAVPNAVAEGADVERFVVASLRDCVRLAAATFSSKGISFPALKAEKVIRSIERALAVG